MSGSQKKRVLVDMSVALLHHGHIRLLERASSLGHVVVALTTDEELHAAKGFWPELDFVSRREILLSIRYVDEVVASQWIITDAFLDEHRIDLLVHGDDNVNPVSPERLVLLPRTEGISSSMLREAIAANVVTRPETIDKPDTKQ